MYRDPTTKNVGFGRLRASFEADTNQALALLWRTTHIGVGLAVVSDAWVPEALSERSGKHPGVGQRGQGKRRRYVHGMHLGAGPGFKSQGLGFGV